MLDGAAMVARLGAATCCPVPLPSSRTSAIYHLVSKTQVLKVKRCVCNCKEVAKRNVRNHLWSKLM